MELSNYGEIEELVVLDNVSDHMTGNVYCKYYREEAAERAQKKLAGRFYGSRLIQAEYSPVTDFREARCRTFHETRCARGGLCNFMHVKHIPKAVKRRVTRDTAAEPETIRLLFDPAGAFAASRRLSDARPIGRDALAAYSILGGLPGRIEAAAEALAEITALRTHDDAEDGGGDERQALDRSMGCMLGNAIGDALGAPLEFSPVRYGEGELEGMGHKKIWKKREYNCFELKPGQWTDDTSMALCLADSLLCCDGLDGLDLRQRFFLWWEHGYNNAFGRDPDKEERDSVGLGGNISDSLHEWAEVAVRTEQTTAGTLSTSGNGSIMRNGAIPLWFREDLQAGMDAAYRQSKATHMGEEAAELCRLLTWICIKLINGAGRELLDDLSGFSTPLYTVRCLAEAVGEDRHEQNSGQALRDRDWAWRSEDYRYSAKRTKVDPGYIGSYAMDAMSMALHCVYTTGSFKEALLKAANLRGDSDTVAAVTGQIAGALYGAVAIPGDWLDHVRRWDGGTICARALMLYNQESLPCGAALSDEACASAGLLGISWVEQVREERAKGTKEKKGKKHKESKKEKKKGDEDMRDAGAPDEEDVAGSTEKKEKKDRKEREKEKKEKKSKKQEEIDDEKAAQSCAGLSDKVFLRAMDTDSFIGSDEAEVVAQSWQASASQGAEVSPLGGG